MHAPPGAGTAGVTYWIVGETTAADAFVRSFARLLARPGTNPRYVAPEVASREAARCFSHSARSWHLMHPGKGGRESIARVLAAGDFRSQKR